MASSVLSRVLRAAPTTGCGRDGNNVDWPCGVVVVPTEAWATLGNAYVITTRSIDAFNAGTLRSAYSNQGTPNYVLALQKAMNAEKHKYVYLHRFGIAKQAAPVDTDDVVLVQFMGGRPFEASSDLLDAIGPEALNTDKYRHVFFRV